MNSVVLSSGSAFCLAADIRALERKAQALDAEALQIGLRAQTFRRIGMFASAQVLERRAEGMAVQAGRLMDLAAAAAAGVVS